jgi:hypothetical protein
VRRIAAVDAAYAMSTKQVNWPDAVTSARLTGRYKKFDLEPREHTMGQIANASNTGHRR